MSRPLVAVLLVGEERVLVEFSGEQAAQLRRALAASSAARRRQIERSVRGYRELHPDVPANQVVRAIGGNRQDVLAADRAVTGREPRKGSLPRSNGSAAENVVPGPGNHTDDGEA